MSDSETSTSDIETYTRSVYDAEELCEVTLPVLENIAIQLRDIAYTLNVSSCGESKDHEEMDNVLGIIQYAAKSLPDSVRCKTVTLQWEDNDSTRTEITVRSVKELDSKAYCYSGKIPSDAKGNYIAIYLDDTLVDASPVDCRGMYTYLDFVDEVSWGMVKDGSKIVASLEDKCPSSRNLRERSCKE